MSPNPWTSHYSTTTTPPLGLESLYSSAGTGLFWRLRKSALPEEIGVSRAARAVFIAQPVTRAKCVFGLPFLRCRWRLFGMVFESCTSTHTHDCVHNFSIPTEQSEKNKDRIYHLTRQLKFPSTPGVGLDSMPNDVGYDQQIEATCTGRLSSKPSQRDRYLIDRYSISASKG